MRLYIQLIPDEPTKTLCRQWQKIVCEPLERRYRLDLIEENQFHLTIAEIRKINADKIENIAKALSTHNQITANTEALKIDWFPSLDKPSVIAAILHLDDELATIYSSIRATINELNIPLHNRPIRPHITLARAHQKSISPEGDLPHFPLTHDCGFNGLKLLRI